MKHLLKHVTETWPGVPVWMRKLHRVGPVGGASCESRGSLSQYRLSRLSSSPSSRIRGFGARVATPCSQTSSSSLLPPMCAHTRLQTTGATPDGKITVRRRRLATFSPTSGSTRSARCRTKWCEIWASRRTTLATAGKGGKLTRTWSTRKRYVVASAVPCSLCSPGPFLFSPSSEFADHCTIPADPVTSSRVGRCIPKRCCTTSGWSRRVGTGGKRRSGDDSRRSVNCSRMCGIRLDGRQERDIVFFHLSLH
jgi:hypothetical protein